MLSNTNFIAFLTFQLPAEMSSHQAELPIPHCMMLTFNPLALSSYPSLLFSAENCKYMTLHYVVLECIFVYSFAHNKIISMNEEILSKCLLHTMSSEPKILPGLQNILIKYLNEWSYNKPSGLCMSLVTTVLWWSQSMSQSMS